VSPLHTQRAIFWVIGAKDSRKNKFAILGVEAPGWQGVKSLEYPDIPIFFAALPNGIHRQSKYDVVFERAPKVEEWLVTRYHGCGSFGLRPAVPRQFRPVASFRP